MSNCQSCGKSLMSTGELYVCYACQTKQQSVGFASVSSDLELRELRAEIAALRAEVAGLTRAIRQLQSFAGVPNE